MLHDWLPDSNWHLIGPAADWNPNDQPINSSTDRVLPDQVEEQHQAVGHPLIRPDDEHVQVDGDGDGPEERAAVGEGGHGPLSDAARRVAAEDAPHAVAIGDGGEQVGHRQEEQ